MSLSSSKGARLAAAAGIGLLVPFAMRPWGLWPLGPLALAALPSLLRGLDYRQRVVIASVFFATGYLLSLSFILELTGPGYGGAVFVEAVIVGLIVGAAPTDRWQPIGFPAAVVVAEAVRWVVPAGGVPFGNFALAQAWSPLGQFARVLGMLGVVGLVAVVAVTIDLLARRSMVAGAIGAVVVLGGVVIGIVAPDGQAVGSLNVALVQGGGDLGTRTLDTDERIVFERHLGASELIEGPVDLVLWPEDVVDVERPIGEVREGTELTALASALNATVVAGVVEPAGPDQFRNLAVAFEPDGRIGDEYQKAHLVPFGEYFPARQIAERFSGLIPDREAVPGDGPAVIDTDAGRFAVSISIELFFGDRARSGYQLNPLALLGPTNSSSYTTTLVPEQTLASSKLRAVEGGRWALQAAPTGYTAFIDHRGRVLERTGLREQAVLERVVGVRSGKTLATRLGATPVLLFGLMLLVASIVLSARQKHSSAV